MPEYYEIKVRGHLEPAWSSWFAGLEVVPEGEDVTLLRGLLPDQSALFGLIDRIRDLNLRLVSMIHCPARQPERNRE